MNQWFRRSSLRLMFIFALTTTSLLLALGVVVSRRGEDIFVGVVQNLPSRQALPNTFLDGTTILQDQSGTHDLDDDPRTAFTEQFEEALGWVTLLGILASVILGFVIANSFITAPLLRLRRAIARLKERQLDSKLEPTGVPEFDEVLHDFEELARELDRTEQLRKNLISDTSHELKTPITSLRAQLEGMREGVVTLDAARVEQLLVQVRRLDDLSDRLQEYARLRSRSVRLHRTQWKLLPLLTALVAEFQGALTEHNITVQIQVPEEYEIAADRALVERMYVNFFKNTLAYAEAHHILLRATPEELVFEDDGNGVPAESLPNLFERFYRVDHSRNRQTGGLGLGLAMVQEIVEAHGWRIQAVSGTAKGKGLRFQITLS